MLDTNKLCSKLDDALCRYATHEEGGLPTGCVNLLSDIKFITDAVEEAAATQSAGSSLPVKVLEELRVLGSTCWNVTVRHRNEGGDEERRLKATLREFATKSFLLGNFVFSEDGVRQRYFTHHPRELEQCLLMCLRTSRDLSMSRIPEGSKALLVMAENIISNILPGVGARLPCFKQRNLNWELEYTKMDVMWNLGHLLETSQSCERLAHMLLQDSTIQRDLRETFFHFIFTAGNTEVSSSEEHFIRAMLLCSTEVQNHLREKGTEDTLRHLSMLRGATLEQMALSWLREGNASEAVRWAAEADSILHSNTSALLHLKATALVGMEQEAVLQLREYVQRPDVPVDDAVAACFDLRKMFTTIEGGSVGAMRLLQCRAKGTSSNECVTFRLVQLLLQDESLESCRLALQVLRSECVDFECAKYRRHCFTWLWELSDREGLEYTEVVEGLEVAIRYADCASDSEIDAVQLRLCTEYVECGERGRHVGTLTKARNVLLKYVERKPRCVFAHVLLLRMSVLEGSEANTEKELRQLTTCEPPELVVPALCTAINFCLRQNCLRGASLAAVQALLSPEPFTDVATELEVLRVYVATVFNGNCAHSDDDLYRITLRFQHLLTSQSAPLKLAHCDVTWWTQAFLLLGSEFTAGPGTTSIALFRTATCIAEQDPLPREVESTTALLAGVLCTLEDEFHLFSAGEPLLNVEELDQYLDVCNSFMSTTSAAEYHMTFQLAKAERHLRSLSAETAHEMERIMKELSTISAPYEIYEALAEGTAHEASRAAAEDSRLHGMAVELFTTASTTLVGHATPVDSGREDVDEATFNILTKSLSCLYKAFIVAFDREQQMRVLQQLTNLLLLPFMGSTVGSLFAQRGSVVTRGTATNDSLAFAFLLLEYFTIEAWNNSVFYLHINDTKRQGEWARFAWALVDTLPPTHRVTSALRALEGITGC